MKKTHEEYLKKSPKRKKIKIHFRVNPIGKKMKSYDNINHISSDFNFNELKGASIDVIFNGVVVGNLGQHAIEEIFI